MTTHVHDLLSEFIDSRLPEAERRLVESHLEHCAECGERLEDLSSISRFLSGMPRAGLPPRFMARLRRKAQAGVATQPSSWRMSMRGAAFALTGFFIALAAYEALRESPFLGTVSQADSALLEPAAPPPAKKIKTYTNETLYKTLETETHRMGIAKVLPKYERPSQQQFSRWQAAGGGQTAMMGRVAAPNLLSGKRPALLANYAESEPAGGSALNASTEEEDAAFLQDGAVLRSQTAQDELWRRLGLTGKPPQADYSRQMLLMILGGGGKTLLEFAEIKEAEGRILVTYRESQDAAGSLYPSRIVPLSNLPVEFKKVPCAL